MKRFLILLLLCAAAFASCQKEAGNDPADGEFVLADGIRLRLDPIHQDETKAIKTGWEDGDVILVFFSSVASPKYLKMSYSSSKNEWSYVEMNGASASPGAIQLEDGASGHLCAVYLPFGRNITVEDVGGDFHFVDNTNNYLYTYYLSSINSYTISSKKLTATLKMKVPNNFVQFYIPDTNAGIAYDTYRLHTDAVRPSGALGVKSTANELITETLGDNSNMKGCVYGSGYIFSGIKNPSYSYDKTYYFTLSKPKESAYRKDLFVIRNAALGSRDAVLLPAEDNARWVEIGADKTVNLGNNAEYGTWYTLNEPGDAVDHSTAESYVTGGKKFMTKAQLDALVASTTITKTPISHYGIEGMVLSCSGVGQFVFIPLYTGGAANYWCESKDADNAYTLYVGQADGLKAGSLPKSSPCRVRLMK